jgi:hypothetical protein
MENIRRYAKIFGAAAVTAAAIGFLTNLKDIRRYIRISTM